MKTITAIRKINQTVATMVLVGAALIPFTSVRAATWTNLVGGVASGNWGTAANWNPNTVPNATDAVADFSTLDLTSDSTITLGSPVIVGTMTFGDTTPSHNWIVSGSVITNTTSTSMPTVTVNNQQVTFSNTLNNSLKKLGPGTLTLAGSGNALYNGFSANGGTLRITGAVTSSNGRVYIGSANLADVYGTAGANGTLVIEPGATLTISSIGTDTFVIGRDNGAVGTVTQNGGTFNLSAANKDYLVGAGAAIATNNLNGGTLNLNANQLGVGNYGSTGVFNLNGGTIAARNVGRFSGGTGTFNFDGGTLQATASRTDFFQGLNTANVKAGGAKIDCNGFTITIAQNLLAAGGGLTKSGAGTLTLSGINTYTGATTVVAGSLVGATGGSCSNSAMTVASGATNGVRVLTAGGKWVCSNLTYSAGTTVLDFDFSAVTPSTNTAPLQVNGDLTLSGTLNITITSSAWVTNGVYPLVKYTGTLIGTPPAAASTLPFGLGAFISNNVANASIDLVVTNANTNAYTWDGTVNNWNTAHWLPGLVNGPTAGGTKTLITSGTVTFHASDVFGNWSTTASPAITLNGGILKSGNNFNTLWNLQMGGGTLLANGGVHGSAQAFQLAGTLTVANTSGNTAPSFISLLSSGNNGLNAVNLGGQGDTAFTMNIADVTGDTAADLAISTVLQNSGPAGAMPLVKAGAGTLALTVANTYSGGTRINAGTVAISNNAAFGSGNVAIASNCTVSALANLSVANACVISTGATALLDVGAGLTLTLSGVLSGPGSLSKANVGALTLSNINTYNGGTAINAGALAVATGGSCANSAVSLAATSGNSATLGVSITDNTKQWTCSSLTVNNAGIVSSLDFNFGRQQPSASVAPLRVTGAATFTTTPTVTVELGGNTGATGTQVPLMTWGSKSGIAPTTVTVIAPHAVTAHLTVTGSTLYLVIDATAEPLRWSKSLLGTWDTTTTNWNDNAGALTSYAETNGIGDSVVFDDTYVTADTTVTLNSTVNPTSVTVNNTNYKYTLSGSGAIAGSTSLTKLGAGTLTLAVAGTHNSFLVNGGNVVVSSNLTVNGTGVSSYFFLGNANTAYSGTLTINTGATVTVTGTLNDNVVIGRDGGSGTVIQNGGLFQLGGRILYVGASNNQNTRSFYNMNGGTLDMGNGTLVIGFAYSTLITGVLNQTSGRIINLNNMQIGLSAGRGVYTLSGGTNIVGVGGITSPSGLYTVNLGGGTLASSATWSTPLNMNLTNLNGSVTFDAAATMINTLSGVLSGNGGLIKAGAGTLILSGTNTYAGATVVSNGTLTLNGSITNCTVAVGTGATFNGTGTLNWQAGQTVTVNGTMNISQLKLEVGAAKSVPFGDWTVVDYQNGTLTGSSFASVKELSPYAKMIYDTTAKKIILKMRPGGTIIRFL